jgi:hypothetical protein
MGIHLAPDEQSPCFKFRASAVKIYINRSAIVPKNRKLEIMWYKWAIFRPYFFKKKKEKRLKNAMGSR